MSPEYKTIGVCDTLPERVEQLAAKFDCRGHLDYQALLDQKPNVVSITLPHHLHFPVAMPSLQAGCHVLLEKPMAIRMDEVKTLVQTA